MTDLSIDIRGLVKRHDGMAVVDHVTLQIQRGEFFSIVGPSGAGKTSLLRMLAGFETPDAGALFIDGRSMAGVPPNRRPVNLVFQSYALFPHLTVAGNVAFGLEMQRVPRAEITERVSAVLELVRLGEKRVRFPHQLSGGEQQRVALARALVNRPSVVLLDEPLAALDEHLRQQMQSELKTIQRQVGLTFVCVTHHQEEALALSDRLAVMHQGRLRQVGRPHELYESPSSLFVARFVGKANELAGVLETQREQVGILRCEHLAGSAPIRVMAPTSIRSGAQVVLVLRPERMRLAEPQTSPVCDNAVSGQIERVRYVGSQWEYTVRLAGGARWTVPVANVSSGRSPWLQGDSVTVQWNTSDGVVLPVEEAQS